MDYFEAGKIISSRIVDGHNLQVNPRMLKAHAYRSFNFLQIALFQKPGVLPEPKFTHRFF